MNIWNEVKLPLLVVALTVAGAAALAGLGYGCYKTVNWYNQPKAEVEQQAPPKAQTPPKVQPEPRPRVPETTPEERAHRIAAICFLVVMVCIYFVPTGIAYSRQHHQRHAILVFNLFLPAPAVIASLLIPALFFLPFIFSFAYVTWALALTWAATATPTPVTARR